MKYNLPIVPRNFELKRLPPLVNELKTGKISDFYEVKDGKIICDTKDEVREAVDKIVESNDWDTEVICNFENATILFKNKSYTDLSKLKLDTSKVTNMGNMFSNCTSLTSIPKLDTSEVTNMRYMFIGCKSLTTIPQLDTSKVTDMSGMFDGCTSLTSIPQLDTSKVTDMRYMFYGCDSLENLGYPINYNKMLEIISTTGIDGKPYKEYKEFSDSELPTKEQFESYEKVRSEGKYNMFMEAEDAAKEAGLSLLDYANVMNHYGELMEMYPEVRKVNFAAKWVVDWTDKDSDKVNSSSFDSIEKANTYIKDRTNKSRSDADEFEVVEGPYEVKNFASKSTTEIKKDILESVGLTEKDISSIKSFKSKGDGYVAIVDCNKVPGFKKGEDSQFKLIRQEKDSHSEKGFETLKDAQDAEKIKEDK